MGGPAEPPYQQTSGLGNRQEASFGRKPGRTGPRLPGPASPITAQRKPDFEYLRLKEGAVGQASQVPHRGQMRESGPSGFPLSAPKEKRVDAGQPKQDTFPWVAFRCCVIQLPPSPPHPQLIRTHLTPPRGFTPHLSVSRTWPSSCLSLRSLLRMPLEEERCPLPQQPTGLLTAPLSLLKGWEG